MVASPEVLARNDHDPDTFGAASWAAYAQASRHPEIGPIIRDFGAGWRAPSALWMIDRRACLSHFMGWGNSTLVTIND
jgi:hypothetical protein